MIRSALCILLLLLSRPGAVAQQQLFICHADSCDVFSTAHLRPMCFVRDSLQLGRQPAYALHAVDSIVFMRPALVPQPLGWWGDAGQGTLDYLAVLTNSVMGYRYRVKYSLTVSNGICMSVICAVLMDEEWQLNDFIPTDRLTDQNDPYIYVKETQTGPRRFEAWPMGNEVLPSDSKLTVHDACQAIWDCTAWLAGRPIGEAQLIVEAWVHEPLRKTNNPDYHE